VTVYDVTQRKPFARIQPRLAAPPDWAVVGIGGAELPGAERTARNLLERSPLRETGYVLLMDALAAQGNVAEAMRIYDHARTTLDQELGITPGNAIQDAHARLLGTPATPH